MKLTNLEEETIIQYILDLDERGYPVVLAQVRDMADTLLAARSQCRVGKNWPANFAKRAPELQMKFNRKLDYSRMLCEDPELISNWFRLVQNTKAKYGIQDEDSWNFDESGFMMGVISTSQKVVTGSERRKRPRQVQAGNREWVSTILGVSGVGQRIPPFIVFKAKTHLASWYTEDKLPPQWRIGVSENGWTTNELGVAWIKHFDACTKHQVRGTYRLLILDGHESHSSVGFEQYCKENKIICLCMPPHSSHILQPLDVGCFSPLKKVYSRQVEQLMRSRINHITKTEFLPAFINAFNASINEEQIKGGFRGAGLVPFNPQTVLDRLDVRLKTPPAPPVEPIPWQSQTPSNTHEIGEQSTLVLKKFSSAIQSSPTPAEEALQSFTKGAQKITHQFELMKARIKELEEANTAHTKRKSRKRTRVQAGGTLSVAEGLQLAAAKERPAKKQRSQVGREDGGESSMQHRRLCSRCNKSGHNVRTCQEGEELSSESDITLSGSFSDSVDSDSDV